MELVPFRPGPATTGALDGERTGAGPFSGVAPAPDGSRLVPRSRKDDGAVPWLQP